MSAGPPRYEDFDAAVLALMAALESGEPLDEARLAVLLQGMGRFLRSRFNTLGREDVVDAVNEGLVRFIAAVRDGRVDPDRRPAGYLTRTAENAALDRLRQQARETTAFEDVPEPESEDAPLDALVNLLASQAIVLGLMAAARDRGEHELNVLIEEFLNLAEHGARPTLRALGAALGVSHTEIHRRLERLASLASEETTDEPPARGYE
jgi:RNA polymerase sigma factor (sigma-70 family)